MNPETPERIRRYYANLSDTDLETAYGHGPAGYRDHGIWVLVREAHRERFGDSPVPVGTDAPPAAAALMDWTLFIQLVVVVNLPPLLVPLGFIPGIGLLAMVPFLFWVNIPGMPLAELGVPYYEMGEFGTMPRGPVGWGLIILFWVLVALVSSMVVKRRRAHR